MNPSSRSFSVTPSALPVKQGPGFSLTAGAPAESSVESNERLRLEADWWDLREREQNLRAHEAQLRAMRVLLAWPTINREGKEAILINCLTCGLIVDVASESEGFAVSTNLLFAEKISLHEFWRAGVEH